MCLRFEHDPSDVNRNRSVSNAEPGRRALLRLALDKQNGNLRFPDAEPEKISPRKLRQCRGFATGI
jgi:hypothetical protein